MLVGGLLAILTLWPVLQLREVRRVRSLSVAPPPHDLRTELLKLRLAQHWARGGLLSETSEVWRPICTALAVAAAGAGDLAELGAHVRAIVAAADPHEPHSANAWRQALAELQAAEASETSEIVNSDDWPASALRLRIAELLESARAGAAEIGTRQRTPSLPPDHGST